MIANGWVILHKDGDTTLLRVADGHAFDMQPTAEIEAMPSGEYDFDFKLIKAIDTEGIE